MRIVILFLDRGRRCRQHRWLNENVSLLRCGFEGSLLRCVVYMDRGSISAGEAAAHLVDAAHELAGPHPLGDPGEAFVDQVRDAQRLQQAVAAIRATEGALVCRPRYRTYLRRK